jgi:hypothetical protein
MPNVLIAELCELKKPLRAELHDHAMRIVHCRMAYFATSNRRASLSFHRGLISEPGSELAASPERLGLVVPESDHARSELTKLSLAQPRTLDPVEVRDGTPGLRFSQRGNTRSLLGGRRRRWLGSGL